MYLQFIDIKVPQIYVSPFVFLNLCSSQQKEFYSIQATGEQNTDDFDEMGLCRLVLEARAYLFVFHSETWML